MLFCSILVTAPLAGCLDTPEEEEEDFIVEGSLPRSAMGLTMPEVDGIIQIAHHKLGGWNEWADSFSFELKGECEKLERVIDDRDESTLTGCDESVPDMLVYVKAVGSSFAMAFEVQDIDQTPSSVLHKSSISSVEEVSASIETNAAGLSDYTVEKVIDCYDFGFCDSSSPTGTAKQSMSEIVFIGMLDDPPIEVNQFKSETSSAIVMMLPQFAVVHDFGKYELTGEYSEINYFKNSQDADFEIDIVFSDTAGTGTHKYTYDSASVYDPMIFGYVNPSNWVSNNVDVSGIEVTQAIQTANMDMPLIAGKPSLARVYIESGTTSSIDVEVRLRACVVIICSQPLTSIHSAPPSVNRDNFDHSANFILPSFWTESPVIYLVADAYVLPGDPVYDPTLVNNRFSSFFSFHETMDFNVWAVKIKQDVSGDSDLEEPTQAMVDKLMLMTEQLFPVDNLNTINFYLDGDMTDCQDETGEDNLKLCAYILQSATITKMNQYQELLDSGTTDYVPPMPDQVFGIFPNNAGVSGVANAAWGGEDPSLVSVGTTGGGGCGHRDLCASHEITHNLGPYCFDNTGDDDCDDLSDESWGAHLSQTGSGSTDNCGAGGMDRVWNSKYGTVSTAYNIKDLGWNSFDDKPETDIDALIDSGMPDYMSYCQYWDSPYSMSNPPEDSGIPQWISTDRWESLFDKFSNWEDGDPIFPYEDDIPPPGRSINVNNQSQNFRVVSGIITENRTGTLLPSWQEDGGVTNSLKDYGSSSDPYEYILYLLDANGNEVEKIFITPHFEDSESREVSHTFSYFVEDNYSIRYIELFDSRMNTTVATLYSQSTPVLSSIGVDQINYDRDDNINVSWNATRGMYYKVQYSWSPDLWIDTSLWITDNNYSFPIRNLPSSENGVVRVIASNGFDTISQQSSSFSIPNQPAQLELKVNGGGISFNTALPQPSVNSSERDVSPYDNPTIKMNQHSSITFEPRIIDYDWERLNKNGCNLELSHNGNKVWSSTLENSNLDGEWRENKNRVKTLQFSDAMESWTGASSNKCSLSGDQFSSITFPNSEIMGADMHPGFYTFNFSYEDNRGGITTQNIDFEVTIGDWVYSEKEITEFQESLVEGNNPPGDNKGCIDYDDRNGNGAYDVGENCRDEKHNLDDKLSKYKAEACRNEKGENEALTQAELESFAKELGLSQEDLDLINLDDCK
ncbi:MAG: hypothetical protein OR994_06080 [Candidatus Poseidoniales archaeon]|nr:hypothetical protein [Candidatus Poseidoniales archaeon]